MPIKIAVRPPALTERLVTTPKGPRRFAGTVSSIILGRATPKIPPQIPKTRRPKQIAYTLRKRVLRTAKMAIILKSIIIFLRPY